MAAGDKLWNLNEDVWVVAPSRAHAAWYIVAEKKVYIPVEARWDPEELMPTDYLTLCNPDDDVHLKDPDGDIYNETAEEFAARVPTGTVIDETIDEDEDDETDDG